MAKQQVDVLQGLMNRLREIRKDAGDRLGELLSEASVRERAAAAGDKIEDLRLELTRRLRGGEPAGKPGARAAKPATRPAAKPATRAATKPLQDMTVHELHELAAKRHIAGRSSMKKAELVDALRKG